MPKVIAKSEGFIGSKRIRKDTVFDYPTNKMKPGPDGKPCLPRWVAAIVDKTPVKQPVETKPSSGKARNADDLA